MSPRRRLLLAVVAALVAVAAVVVGVRLVGGAERELPAQDRPGTVILVPGYGGSQEGLRLLDERLRDSGRDTHVMTLPGNGTGDLLAQVAVLDREVDAALDRGAPSVDIIGYSAGGLVARLWAVREQGERRARRVVTLGSPLHGTRLAASGGVVAPDACPVACQQMIPGSALLASVAQEPVRLPWLSVWTENDQTVTPPDSARLDGAENLALQEVCPGVHIEHGELPTHPLVVAIVLRSLGPDPLTRRVEDVGCPG
ncbi:MAG TPA: alpha/beta fold hydrolase [Actinophytocola sp.]|uniref:esterase/lipase family protein n=1 Tax=Actinophytocola sp. TaxID=1872138 RepID=UPI002DDDA1B9|nr:alpha/beta fold hydrolase [Actinophytocola sp.]HEV2784153.1 alpha/beta fold hydrolase [Actinophytocola sp.]